MKNIQKEFTKEQKEILQGLFSTDEKKVLDSIKLLRTKGGVFSVKPLLEIYFTTKSDSIRDAVYALVCDLKLSKTAEIFANNIELYSKQEGLAKLLSAFWQSSIKFSELLPFIKVFFDSDNSCSVEILTIVEQNIYNVSNEDKWKCDELITSKMSEMEGFKLDIAKEILVMLK